MESKVFGLARTLTFVDDIYGDCESATWDDLRITGLAIAFSFALCRMAFQATLRPCARSLIVEKKRNPLRIDRFVTCVFSIVYFSAIVAFEYHLFRDVDYISAELGGKHPGYSREHYEIFYGSIVGYKFRPGEKLFYLTCFGFHFHNLVWTALFGRRQSDFCESFIHHVATSLLICLSFLYMGINAGVSVLLCHDFVDIFVYSTKIFADTHYEPLAILSFIGVTLSWAYIRLYAYPLACIAPGHTHLMTPWEDRSEILKQFAMPDNTLWIIQICLGTLYLLHIFWFSLFVRIWIAKCTEARGEDRAPSPKGLPSKKELVDRVSGFSPAGEEIVAKTSSQDRNDEK